jgi:pimeloyl-ACP methyl ester carboxylesterase
VRGDGAALAALGRGRFDVVSWDPRGTGASTRVRCFSSAAAQSRFWGVNWSIPTTRSQSLRYVVKATAFARRCAALSGSLLAHISTEDTARDLDYLRWLVGDRQLTYLGWSYGTFLGQTYANMFPRRVRAMVLDGAVDPVAFTTSVAASIAGNIGDTDRVFAKLVTVPARRPGALRARRPWPGLGARERFAGALAPRPDPGAVGGAVAVDLRGSAARPVRGDGQRGRLACAGG